MKRLVLLIAIITAAAALAAGCSSGGNSGKSDAKTVEFAGVQFELDPCLSINELSDSIAMCYLEGDSESDKNGEPVACIIVMATESHSGSSLVDKDALVDGVNEIGVEKTYTNIAEGSIGSHKTLSYDVHHSSGDSDDSDTKCLYIQMAPESFVLLEYSATDDIYDKYIPNVEAAFASVQVK